MSEHACPPHGLRRAAAEVAVVLGVRPQLQRHRDRLRSTLGHEQGGDGAVDATAHRDEGAPGARRHARRACGAAERAVQRVGCQLGSVALCGAEAAELGRDLIGPDARRVEQRRPPEHPDDSTAGGDARTAAARVGAGVGDPPEIAGGIERERDADEIAAGGASGRAGVSVGGRVPAPVGAFEMARQLAGTVVHTSECKGRVAPAARGGAPLRWPAGSRTRPAGR